MWRVHVSIHLLENEGSSEYEILMIFKEVMEVGTQEVQLSKLHLSYRSLEVR